MPSLDVHAVDKQAFVWPFVKPVQPHLAPLPPIRMPKCFPSSEDVIAIDAEFVSTATQEVTECLQHYGAELVHSADGEAACCLHSLWLQPHIRKRKGVQVVRC